MKVMETWTGNRDEKLGPQLILPAISFEEVLKDTFSFYQSLIITWQSAYHKLEGTQTHRQVTACLKQAAT